MTIEAVVLDIGNVLIEWNPERFYDARLGADRRRRFFEQTRIHEMNLEVDRGADSAPRGRGAGPAPSGLAC